MNWRTGTWGVAALLAACGGGGEVAVLPFVAPANGLWQGGQAGIGGWVVDAGEEIDFGAGNDFFAPPTAEVPATLTTKSLLCGPAKGLKMVARFDGANFTLSVPGVVQLSSCLRGAFVDEITLRLDTGGAGTLFRKSTATAPDFQVGVWQNIDRTSQQLRFRDDASADESGQVTQTGCEFVDGTQAGVVQLRYTPGNAATDPRLKIDSLTITRNGVREVIGPGRLFGLSGMQLDSVRGTVSLQRIEASQTCS